MAKEIKQKIVLSGEKEYNQALKDAQRNLKTLQTALKAETAELGKNASEQDKARVKAESLRKQIAEQEKVVKTLQEALAKAREEYGDNEAEIARWEQKLNNARATLAGMKNDLSGVGDGMQQISTDAAAATVATKSVADALGEISGAGDAVAGVIEGIFQGMIDTVSNAVSELWGMISSTAAKANQWTDIAGYWGTDAQTIQQFARATQASANSFEDLQSAVSKIVLGGKGKKITELIGISDVNYKNEWDYAMAVMDQLYSMSRRGENMTPIYEQLFGEKKATKVMDLINDWGAVKEYLPQFNGNETGYGMSDEELGTMNDLWVKINEIETKWQALKENFAAGFGVGTMELLVNVEGTLDGLAAYMNATDEGEKQAALEQIRKNIEEFFRKVAEIIRESLEILRGVGEDLQKSDDPLTQMVGDILVKVSDALQWFVDNQEAVKGAFNAIFGVWFIAKLAAVAGKLSEILLQIETIKAFKGISLLGGAGDAAAAGGSILSKLGGALATVVKKAGPAAAFFGTLFGNYNNTDTDDILDENGQLTESAKKSGLTEADIGKSGTEPVVLAVVEPETEERKISDEERMLQALAAESEANARAAQAEAEARERNQKAEPEESVYFPEGVVIAETEPEEETIEESLDDLGEMQRQALEDLFDAWRETEGEDPGEEEFAEFDRMWDYAQGIFGDAFGDVLDQLVQKMDEDPNWMKNDDIPPDWLSVLSSGTWNQRQNGATNENGITRQDLAGFNALPGNIRQAVENGARKGVSGIQVSLDGYRVGQLIAPYVSEMIAREFMV